MPIIDVSNLEKVFVSNGGIKTLALRGVTFNVEHGEFVSIMGQSGSGKLPYLIFLGF